MKGIYIFTVIFALQAINCQLQTRYAEQSTTELTDLLGGNISENLEDIYHNLAVIKQIKPTTVKGFNVCPKIKALSNLDTKNTYLQQQIASTASCTLGVSNDFWKTAFKAKLATPDDFEVFYYASQGLIAASATNDEIKTNTCSKLINFLQTDGTTRQFASKTDSGNYFYSSQLFELYDVCITKNISSSDLLLQLQTPVQSILLNVYNVQEGQKAILEKANTVTTNLNIIKFFEKISSQTTFQSFVTTYRQGYFAGIWNFVAANVDSVLNASERNAYVQFQKVLPSLSVFTLVQKSYLIATSTQVIFSFKDIFATSQIIDAPTISANLTLNGKTVSANLKWEKSEKFVNSYVFKIPGSVITASGYYDIDISSTSPVSMTTSESVLFSTAVSIKSVEFEIVQGKSSPQKYTNKITGTNQVNQLLEANQNSYIHFNLELQFGSSQVIQPNQVGVLLKHPAYDTVTTFVSAEYDQGRNLYRAVLDLGDPDVILPFNAFYSCNVIVADQRISSNIQQKISEIKISFTNPLTTPPSDADLTLDKEIRWTFPEPHQNPDNLFIGFFVVLMGASLILFLNCLCNLKANFGRVQNGLPVFLFIGCIIGLMAGLFIFWTKINLMEFMQYLVYAAIPILVIGNWAITSLKQEKQKTD